MLIIDKKMFTFTLEMSNFLFLCLFFCLQIQCFLRNLQFPVETNITYIEYVTEYTYGNLGKTIIRLEQANKNVKKFKNKQKKINKRIIPFLESYIHDDIETICKEKKKKKYTKKKQQLTNKCGNCNKITCSACQKRFILNLTNKELSGTISEGRFYKIAKIYLYFKFGYLLDQINQKEIIQRVFHLFLNKFHLKNGVWNIKKFY